MTKSTCTIDGCDKNVRCKGLCITHYQRLIKTGSTDDPVRLTLEQRFWSKVDKSGTCWEWRGGKEPRGYGHFRAGERTQKAHRVAYELTIGPIPDGLLIDHTCHNRACVNPAHLRLATHKQNSENLKGVNPSNVNSGVRGVYRRGDRWGARVFHDGTMFYFGMHSTIAEAEAAAIEGRRRLFTHSQD